MMHRRTFLCGLMLGTLAAPLVAGAQQTPKVPRIVFLNDEALGSLAPAWVNAFRQALSERGWLEARNVVIEFRSARTIDERPRTVAEVVALKPDVIVAAPPAAFTVSPNPTSPPTRGWTPVQGVPIVFLGVSDPVAAQMGVSLARPGGMMTGLSLLSRELNTKRLELLKEAVPNLSRMAVLWVPGRPGHRVVGQGIESAAQRFGVTAHFLEVGGRDDVTRAFAAFHPDWKLLDRPPTRTETLTRAREIALANGIRYAYTGNVHDVVGQSTSCSGCGAVLIERDWYELGARRLDEHGRCAACDAPCAGVFDGVPGRWGARRLPVRLRA